jgi:hypothetical protein
MTPQTNVLAHEPPNEPEGMRHYPVVENLISLFANWLAHRRARPFRRLPQRHDARSATVGTHLVTRA